MADITIKGLEELRRNLDEFSDRRFAAAVATAMSRSAVLVRDKMRKQMAVELDRPTPYTLNSLYTVPATAEKLQAKVLFRGDRGTGGGTPATYFMYPEVHGGPRRQKGFELALQSMGVLPRGWLAVPGEGADLDRFGNVTKARIGQIMRGLTAASMAGPRRAKDAGKLVTAARSAGGTFFAVQPGGRLQPGVYRKEFIGRNITPVLIFVEKAKYRKRFSFYERGQEMANEFLQPELQRAIAEHIDRMSKR